MSIISRKNRKSPANGPAAFLGRMRPSGGTIFLCSYANNRSEAGTFPPRDATVQPICQRHAITRPST